MDKKVISVLAIEDNADDAELLQGSLYRSTMAEFRLTIAETLAAGLVCLANNEFDIVLADLGLEDSQGLDTLRSIKSAYPNIPIVVLTGLDDDQIGVDAVHIGAQDYLLKDEINNNFLGRVVLYAIERHYVKREQQSYRDRLEAAVQQRTAELLARNEQLQREVIQRKLIEASLQENQRILTTLTNTLPGIAYRCANDKHYTMLFISDGCREITGYASEDFIGNRKISYAQLIHPDDQTYVRDEIQKALADARPFQLTYRIISADGQTKWLWEKGVGVLDSEGTPLTLEGFITDITDIKQTQIALQENISMLESVYMISTVISSTLEIDEVLRESVRLAAQTLDVTSAYICDWNAELGTSCVLAEHIAPSAAEQERVSDLGTTYRIVDDFGDTPSWLDNVQLYWTSHIDDSGLHPKERSHMQEFGAKSILGVPLAVKDRVIGYIELWESRHKRVFGEQEIALAIAIANQVAMAMSNAQLHHDLQAHAKNLEQLVLERTAQLHQTKEQVEAILNGTSEGIALVNPEGKILQVNPAFNTLFGYQDNDLFNQPLTIVANLNSRTSLTPAIQTVASTQRAQRMEITGQHSSGRDFAVDLSLAPIADEDKTQVVGIVCSARDITHYKRVEESLRRGLEKEHELNQLKSQFMAMVTHEFKNPLTTIMLMSDLIENYWERLDREAIKRKLGEIRLNTQRIRALTDDILSIEHMVSQEVNLTQVDVTELCQQIISKFEQTIAEGHRLHFSSSGYCTLIPADTKLLQRTVENLLSNAVKYSPSGSSIYLSVACSEDQTAIQVKDEGIGIPENDQQKLFELFHRASNVGAIDGTGLGLAIVKNAVDLHNGSITVESQEGVGTVFTVTLPHKN